MVKVTFKNVGQGDSIIIEWKLDEISKIGIIDCNLFQGKNPILEHIVSNKYEEIEFLILSHPHLDHFSGFLELLNYCQTNNIRIFRFLHTAQVTPDYLKAATKSIVEGNALFELYTQLKLMILADLIEVYAIDDNPNLKIPIGEEFTMEVLSPSSREIIKYISGENYPFDEEGISNSNSNWLSTCLKLYNDEVTILLTSDIESGVLTRIGKKNGGRLNNAKIILAQIPHHGSKGNLNKTFWQMRKRFTTTPIVVSVGRNQYKHPSKEVIDFFKRLSNYELLRTDSGVLLEESQQAKDTSSLLDIFSSQIPKDITSGDKAFKLSKDSIHSL